MKSNWKKLLSLALVLALMLGFAPGIGLTARAEDATAISIYMSDGKLMKGNAEWGATNNKYELSAGNYKLTSDIITDHEIRINSVTASLDLNGHGILTTGNNGVIAITGTNGKLTLTDSAPGNQNTVYLNSGGRGVPSNTEGATGTSVTGGYIAGGVNGGSNNLNGGGVYTNFGCEFTMSGGTIIGNVTNHGGGVHNNGTFTLRGGTITKNVAANGYGGGIYNNDTFNISGNPVVRDNKKNGANLTDNNLFVAANGYKGNNFINIVGALTDGASIGVTYQENSNEGVFAKPGTPSGGTEYTITTEDASKFTSDNTNYAVGKNAAGQLLLGTPVTVTFNADGGSAVASQTIASGSVITKPADPTRDNYTFGGWYTDSDLTSAFDFNTAVTSDTTLYAKWTLNTYTVTFDANGGSAVASQTIDSGGTVTKPADPTKDHYTFGGWYTDSDLTSAFDFTAAVTADTTLYAKWALNTYTVTFDANGGTGIMAKQTASYNVAAELTANAFTRADDTFAGWNTSADGTGTPYADGASITLTGDLTLYAQWTDKALYTVSGTVTQGSDTVSGATVQLVRGEKKIAVTATDAEGKYSFSAPKDTYNIVAEHNGTSKTELVALNDNQEVNISMPSAGVNSKLTVSGSEITNVMVGGLDELAEAVSNGAPVTVTMTVEEKAAADVGDTEKNAIIAEAGENQTLDYLDIAIRNGATPITDTDRDYNKVLEIIVPYRFTGKENVAVYRYHDSAMPLDQLNARPSGSYDDGKYYIDKANSLIYIYASKFSTYAIGYTQCYNISGTIRYGTTYTDSVRVSLLEGETEKYTATVSLSGGSGTYSFTHVLAGTYTLRTVWTEGGKETTLNETLLVQ